MVPPFSFRQQFIFKGTVAWVAALFITYLAFVMLQYQGWEEKWARKLAVVKVSEAVRQCCADPKPLSRHMCQVGVRSC